jgi:predicted Zn-dependent protease with MMP-like domain
MDFRAFERRAQQVFDEIPEEFREGIDGLDVRRSTVPHPSLPEVYTLGECLTDTYPGEFGGPGEVRSTVVLYYGSFLELSRIDEEWDWEEEIFTTVTHEVQHHRESLALEESLEELDYAEDQNFARREGESFDPFFYQRGTPAGESAWEVDGDVFLEAAVGKREAAAGSVTVRWGSLSYRVPLAERLPDVHFVRLAEREDATGDIYAVLLRRRGLGEWVAALFGGRALEVSQSDLEPDAES